MNELLRNQIVKRSNPFNIECRGSSEIIDDVECNVGVFKYNQNTPPINDVSIYGPNNARRKLFSIYRVNKYCIIN